MRKSKIIILCSLLLVLLSCQSYSQAILNHVSSVKSVDSSDSIRIYYGAPRLHLFQGSNETVYALSSTDTIKEVKVSEGIVTKREGFFTIRTNPDQEDIDITFIGKHIYKYNEVLSKKLPSDINTYLKNILVEKPPRSGNPSPFYSIETLINNGKLASTYGSLYKILEFQILISRDGLFNQKESAFFKGDSIPADYSESLKKYFPDNGPDDRISITLQNVKYLGPDSGIFITDFQPFCRLYKDSADLLIAKYLDNSPALEGSRSKIIKSDIRIKIEGNARPGDIAAIRKIAEEFNSIGTGLKARIVKRMPSIVVRFDTIQKQKGPLILYTYTPDTESDKPVLFFPWLSHKTILIDSTIRDQRERDLIIWQRILRSVATFVRAEDNSNSLIIGSAKIPGLTYADKLAVRTILSPSNFDKVNSISSSATPINFRVLFFILLSIILFFIFYEISYYFNINGLIKNEFTRKTLYLLLIAQLVIAVSYIVGLRPSGSFIKLELYTCTFVLVAGWLFALIDIYLLKMIRSGWQRLLVNPLLTLVSLYIAYQIIYLFERAGFLRFVSIDYNALLVGISIVAVRFYLQYENGKITSLINEKEFELTRQKELKARAELNTLQAKINPHFLYNSLNSIAALAHINPKRTEEMALSLSKLFRYNVNRDESITATIREEIEMVQLYVEIEKQRFGERLSFEIAVAENLNDREVPRALIQPLIENAFKHGVSKITGTGIVKLKIYELEKNLYIEVHDNGPVFPKGLVTGYGLQNTYDKLDLVYKKHYEIRFENGQNKYIQIKL